ncbi:hypothetical protein AVEN_146035-1 [Araneus ventricosus]|uniref:Uncharacterized protein n=1 Tax=Araneus ventricosus TaxID=182803 RepID=A0A4Y2GW12_ARAVE|nr:hypothetical protein AVEN_146035-1 [Araneus ventricosus]
MNAVSIPGSEELEVLSPSCIEIVQAEENSDILQQILEPRLVSYGIMNDVAQTQKLAPLYFAMVLHDYLSRTSPGCGLVVGR